MKNKTLVDSLRFARYFAAARSKAAVYLAEPECIKALLNQAGHKAEHLKAESVSGPFKSFTEQIALISRLLLAYGRGEYRVIPWESVLMATAALVYFLMPFDALADWLVGLGFIDDALVMALAFKALKADLSEFSTWENEHMSNADR